MPAMKEQKNNTDFSENIPCRKILTLSGLKDRREHKNRVFTTEEREEARVKKGTQ